jgi:hypothetical protein
MKIIDRIFEYINYKGVKIAEFERQNALSNGYLRKMKQRSADIGETIIVSILENCPDISVEWFILGSGSMLKANNMVETPLESDNTTIKILLKHIEEQAIEIDHLRKGAKLPIDTTDAATATP